MAQGQIPEIIDYYMKISSDNIFLGFEKKKKVEFLKKFRKNLEKIFEISKKKNHFFFWWSRKKKVDFRKKNSTNIVLVISEENIQKSIFHGQNDDLWCMGLYVLCKNENRYLLACRRARYARWLRAEQLVCIIPLYVLLCIYY